MRIKVFTHWSDEYKIMMALTSVNRLEYCLRYGYDYVTRHHSSSDCKTIQKERELFLIDELKDCEYLLFMGADTLFTNMNIKVEDIINKFPIETKLIIGNCYNGINNDVMFIKSCQESINYFLEVLKRLDHQPNDQGAQNEIGDSFPNFLISRPHQKLFNSMPTWLYPHVPDPKGGTWSEGDYIFHVPGLAIQQRIQCLQDILKKVIR